MKLFFFILLFSTHAVFAQKNDSIRYYQKELAKLHRQAIDSLRKTERYIMLSEKLKQRILYTDNYTSFNLYYENVSADYSAFNQVNNSSGFGNFKGNAQRFGIGISNKKGRRMFDMTIFALGINRTKKNGDEKITTRLSNLFALEWGYDFVKSKTVNIYPFAGVSIRTAVIDYNKPTTFSSPISSISQFVTNNQSAFAESFKLGYQAGVGFEFVVTKNASSRSGGTILFVKTGINKPFTKEKYKVENTVYPHEITYGNLAIAAGFKFFGK